MQLFVHYKIQKIDGFFSQLSQLNQLHQSKKFSFSKEFNQYTDELVSYFEQIGDSNNQAEVEQLKNYYQLAEGGVSPNSLEKIKTGRRSLLYSSAFHCLSSITNLLQQQLQKDQQKIDTAMQAMGPLVLSLVQAKVITDQELSKDLSQDDLKKIWDRINQNEQVKIHVMNLKLTLTKEDIFLLFCDVIDKIKN